MKIVGALIPKVAALYEAYRVLHGRPPTVILLSEDIRIRLIQEVDDVREVFGEKRTGQVISYRKAVVTPAGGENHISFGG